MKKTLMLMLVCVFAFASCKKDEPVGLDIKIIDTSIRFLFVDANGNNLLNESIFHGLKLFNVVDGVEKEVLNAGNYTPRGMEMEQQLEGEYKGQAVLKITANPQANSNLATNLLKWTIQESRTFIIQSEFEQLENMTTISKVWVDGELVWDAVNTQAHYELTGETLPRLIVIEK